MRRLCATLVLACAITTSSVAMAQDTDVALADTLYRQGRALMDEKRYDEACQKFAESHRLDPATGTLLNLAACNEARGKTATAWLEFNDALLSARRDQRDDRVKFASERILALEPKLSRLTVTVKPEAEVEGLEVRVDGTVIGPAARGVPTPMDPGKHTISASAPGKKPWSRELELGREADSQTIEVPPLETAPGALAADPADKQGTSTPITGPDRVVTERPTPTSVYVLGGVSAAMAIGAVVTGSFYLDRKARYNELNNDDGAPDEDKEKAMDAARLWGTANVVLVSGALIGAAGTAYLYFTRPEVRTTASTSVTPWIGSNVAGVSLQGPLF